MKNLLRPALITAFLLSIPLIAQWPWTLGDFVIMGALIFCVGLVYEFVVRKVENGTNRMGFTVLLVAAFLLVWAELAVGIFGSPFAGS